MSQLTPLPKIPTTTEELLAGAKRPVHSLAEEVADVCVDLYKNQEFRRLLQTVSNETSVEGLQKYDDSRILQMIRDHAREIGNMHVANTPFNKLSKPMQKARQWLNIDRKRLLTFVPGAATNIETNVHMSAETEPKRKAA